MIRLPRRGCRALFWPVEGIRLGSRAEIRASVFVFSRHGVRFSGAVFSFFRLVNKSD